MNEDKIKVNPERFIDYVLKVSKTKRSQLIQLAQEVEVTGEGGFHSLETELITRLTRQKASDNMSNTLALLKVVQEWSEVIYSSNLGGDWVPMLVTANRIEGDKEKVHFLNPSTQEIRIIELDGNTSTRLKEQLRTLYEKIPYAVPFEELTPKFLGYTAGREEGIDGLNAAFTVQALLHFFQQQDRAKFQLDRGPLSKAIEVHNYLNLAQVAHATILDTSKVIGLVKALLQDEAIMVEKPLSAFTLILKQLATEGLAAGGNIASIVLDIIELTKARAEAERAVFSTQLAFDTGGLTLAGASMSAGYIGASTVASMLGAGTVILSGFGIGITALVQAFGQVVVKAQAVGTYFYQLNLAYENRGYQPESYANNQSLMTPMYGAVITEINFRNDTIHYGSPYLYRSRHGRTGSGRMNYFFWLGDFPTIVRDKNQALNVRERLGYPKQTRLESSWKGMLTWELPDTPTAYIDYRWQALPFATGRHDKGFSVLRRLEEEEDFDYDFYIFPSEYLIHSIHEERVPTPIKIVLDSQKRTLVIPKFSEGERELPTYLHYTVEGPEEEGRCSIVLNNKVGSLTLESHHHNYTWILYAGNFSGEDLKVTPTSINIKDISVDISPSSAGEYLLVDKDDNVYKVNLSQQVASLVEFSYRLLKKDAASLTSYLRNRSSNSTIIVNHFPLKDDLGADYNGTVYYSPTENQYCYTQGMPKVMTTEASLVNGGASFSKDCYFSLPPDLLWRTNNQTYQLEKKYVLYSTISLENYTKEQKNTDDLKREIGSILIEADDTIKVTQLWKDRDNQTIRCATYHLVQDKLILFDLSDDELLSALHRATKKDKQAPYLDGKHERSRWEDYPSLPGEVSMAQMDQVVAIRPLSPDTNVTRPLWVRKKDENTYQLINPNISGKELLFLGSLLARNHTEVFFFLIPRKENSHAQLFRQPEDAENATGLDLSLVNAFWSQDALFILTPDHLIKKIDALGGAHIDSFTANWTSAHPNNWWEGIPPLLGENHKGRKHLSIYGITNQAGKALGVWYDYPHQSFILTQPPTKPDGQQFHISYLGQEAGVQFFFCENGVLYRQKPYSSPINSTFQGTQLKQSIPPLETLYSSLESAYLYKQRLWMHDEKGFVLSSNPRQLKYRFLEKIEYPCYLHADHVCRNSSQNADVCFKNESLTVLRNNSITIRENTLIPIELDKSSISSWWSLDENKCFRRFLISDDGLKCPDLDDSGWAYLGIEKTEGRNPVAFFFSLKDRMVYSISKLGSRPACTNGLPAQLAIRSGSALIWVLDASNSSHIGKDSFPLLNNINIFGLYITSKSNYSITMSEKIMNHYPMILYQIGSSSLRSHLKLSFKKSDSPLAKKNGQDIVIFHANASSQLILLQAMLPPKQNPFENCELSTQLASVDSVMKMSNQLLTNNTIILGTKESFRTKRSIAELSNNHSGTVEAAHVAGEAKYPVSRRLLPVDWVDTVRAESATITKAPPADYLPDKLESDDNQRDYREVDTDEETVERDSSSTTYDASGQASVSSRASRPISWINEGGVAWCKRWIQQRFSSPIDLAVETTPSIPTAPTVIVDSLCMAAWPKVASNQARASEAPTSLSRVDFSGIEVNSTLLLWSVLTKRPLAFFKSPPSTTSVFNEELIITMCSDSVTERLQKTNNVCDFYDVLATVRSQAVR